MHTQKRLVIAPLIALSMSLSACGGGGSSGIASTPPPAPTPATPPPQPPPSGQYSGSIALQSSLPFAATGYATRYSVDVAGTNERLLSGPSQSDTIVFRQLLGTNQYELALPGYQAGELRQIYLNGSSAATERG